MEGVLQTLSLQLVSEVSPLLGGGIPEPPVYWRIVFPFQCTCLGYIIWKQLPILHSRFCPPCLGQIPALSLSFHPVPNPGPSVAGERSTKLRLASRKVMCTSLPGYHGSQMLLPQDSSTGKGFPASQGQYSGSTAYLLIPVS